MNLHSLENTAGARHRKRRVGRGMGSGSGKTCGTGHKGQMSRKGNKHKRSFEGGQMPLVRRLPKRGFTNISRKNFAPVNVCSLERFEDGTEVGVAMLRECGLVNGRTDGIKILGTGDLARKLVVKAERFSSTARAKIEAAGGTCEVVAG